MSRLDIYICTKSKCTAKRVQVKLRTTDEMLDFYDGLTWASVESIEGEIARAEMLHD